MNAGARSVQRQLADRDAHAVGAKIAEAENALAVGDHDELGRVGPVAQDRSDAAAVVGGHEQAARPLENVAEPLAGKADRRGVDQRLDLVDIVGDDAEEQRFVAVVQRVERDVFFQIVGQLAQIGHHAFRLRLHRQHMGRQKAAQSERVAFLIGEPGAPVEQRIAQKRDAARVFAVGRLSGRPVERVHGRFPSKIDIRRQTISIAVIQTGFTFGPWHTFAPAPWLHGAGTVQRAHWRLMTA